MALYETNKMGTLNIPYNSIYTKTIKVQYKDGTPYDLAGVTFYFVAMSDPTDAIADAVINHNWNTHTDAANGETTMTLPKSTAAAGTKKTLGRYYYTLRMVKTGVDLASYLGIVNILPNTAGDAT